MRTQKKHIFAETEQGQLCQYTIETNYTARKKEKDYGNERASVIAKATNYLDSNYDFKSKSNEAIMSDVVKA